MIKLSDYVSKFVAEQGVKHVFMVPGGGCMHLVDSFGKQEGMEYVACLHEQACGFAGEAYAEFKNDLAAMLVTTGPGGTNVLTGVACSWLESSSCLFISGQAKRADMIGSRGVRSMGQQEVDIISVVRPITKYAVSVLEPETIRYHLEKAVHLARSGRRGPVWIEIPLDVQSINIDENSLKGFEPEPVATNSRLQEWVAKTIELLNRAKKPVLLIGNGARGAFNSGLIDELLKALPVPVLTTWKAIDFLADDHPLFAGRPGIVAERAANLTQQASDCVVVLGARLDLPQIAFNHRNFAPRASKIVVDADPAELGKLDMDLAVSACADVADYVREFLRQAGRLVGRDHSGWVARCKEHRTRFSVFMPEQWNRADGKIDVYALVKTLSDLATDSDLFVPGSSGPPSDIFLQSFRVKRGQRILNAPGLGAMGTGLPATIGACLASGGRRTICVNGDGGFQLNIQELETVRRLGLPIKFFVLCNGGYASIRGMQNNYFQGRFVACDPSSGLSFPDVIKVAQAYGLATASIADASKLRESVHEVLETKGPIVCAVDVALDQAVAPRVTTKVGADGLLVSRPMEDMWPYLEPHELKALLD